MEDQTTKGNSLENPLLHSLEVIQRSINDINIEQETIIKRLDRIEQNQPEETRDNVSSRAPARSQVPPFSGRHVIGTDPLTVNTSDKASDIQREYECIKDSLNKVILPNELKLLEAKTGIKREDQPHLLALGKSARYSETCLKLLSTFDDSANVQDLTQIYTVLVAHINFLQSEYAGLVVKGQFDKDTASLFKCLERNTNQFTSESLDNLKTAAEISAAKSRFKPEGNIGRGNRGRGTFYPRRPFGTFRRGSYFPRYGSSYNASNNEVPRERDDGTI